MRDLFSNIQSCGIVLQLPVASTILAQDGIQGLPYAGRSDMPSRHIKSYDL